MPKTYVHTTPIASLYNVGLMAKDSAKFLVEQARLSDRDPSGYASLFINVGNVTHMQQIFKNIIESRKLNNVHLFSFSKGLVDIPELLTMEDIVVDGKYLPITLPSELKKPWVNLTPMVAANQNDRFKSIELVDAPKAVSAIVRAFLTASYNDSDEWLSPKLSTFLIEFYIYSVGKVFNRMYNLDFGEAGLVSYLFAWYYASLLGPKNDKADDPILLRRNRSIFKVFDSSQIDNLHKSINDIRENRPMSIDVIIEVINKIGAKRMAKLSRMEFVKAYAISATDNIATIISLDYPPYLMHQILRMESGAKHSIFSDVYNNRFSKLDLLRTLDQLALTKSLYEVNR